MLHLDSVPNAVADLLRTLAPAPSLADFSLGGGTALALRFGHRISVDLDFFTTTGFNAEELLQDPAFPTAPTVLNRAEGSLAITCNNVKVEFLRHSYPLLEPIETIDGSHLLSLADVTAMKLNAITNRGSKKDFYDLARIIEEMSLDEALTYFERKYANTDRFVAIRSLGWFEDAESEPDPVVPAGPGWPEVKDSITAALAALS